MKLPHFAVALLLATALAGSLPACAAEPTAPNQVAISAQLVTSGQPPAAALASLRQQGFDAVIYL
ncbi:MAG TPA: hypothetical protein VLA16_19815, partial [Ideonella sp.]|nr:hypothetical protein [Ideonella sp.]